MEEDITQYFNDEWNISLTEFIEKYVKVIDKDGIPQNMILRDTDRYYIKEFEKLKNVNK